MSLGPIFVIMGPIVEGDESFKYGFSQKALLY